MSHNTTNSTTGAPTPSPTSSEEGLPPALAAVVSAFLALLMVGMGATVSIAELKETLRQPKQVYIGLSSQWFVMPFVAWSLAQLLGLNDNESVGLILVGCCPGGTASNLMSYIARADMSLGISLTLITNILSIGSLPLLLLVYTSGHGLSVPHGRIALSMLLVVVPIAVGLAVRHYAPQHALKVTRLGSTLGFILIGGGAIAVAVNPGDRPFYELPWQLFVSLLALFAIGVGFGATMAYMAGFGPGARLTVALETGVQNAALAVALVALNFEEPELTDILYFPVVYGTISFVLGLAMAFLFRRPRSEARFLDHRSDPIALSTETNSTDNNCNGNAGDLGGEKQEPEHMRSSSGLKLGVE